MTSLGDSTQLNIISLSSTSAVPTGRKKNDKSLFTMQQSEEQPSERFLTEIASALRVHELVRGLVAHRCIAREMR